MLYNFGEIVALKRVNSPLSELPQSKYLTTILANSGSRPPDGPDQKFIKLKED